MTTLNASYKTIYNWLKRWETEGMIGLYNKPGRGRKRTFNQAQEETIRAWAKQEPRPLKQVALPDLWLKSYERLQNAARSTAETQ